MCLMTAEDSEQEMDDEEPAEEINDFEDECSEFDPNTFNYYWDEFFDNYFKHIHQSKPTISKFWKR